MFSEYKQYDALGLSELVKKDEVSPKELLHTAKNELSKINPKINAVICEMDSLAETLISKLDKNSLFCGVPFLVKDLMLPFAGYPLSNGSRAMKSYVPEYNSEMVDKLNTSGLITFGKTNTSELGASSLVNPAAFGPTLNPWDITKNSGGSSGGSSAAVASRIVPMAYSSDGGGSIRLPASYCGIFGYKPSRNLNKYENMSEAWGGAVVSHVSSISVRDSAAYLDMVTGKTGGSYSISEPDKNSYLFSTTQAAKKLKIGLITDAPTDTPVYSECINAAEKAAVNCESLGHHVEHSQWNFNGRELMRAFLTIVFNYTHRDVNNMAVLLGVESKKLQVELNTRFMSVIGSSISSEQIEASLKIWQNASQKMADLHNQYDVILTPTVATAPLTSDELDPNKIEKLLMQFLISTGLSKKILNNQFLETLIDKSLYQTPFTPIANMTGQPAVSVPLYWGKDGLPHGAHFMAAEGNDEVLFMLSGQLESEYPWKDKAPKM